MKKFDLVAIGTGAAASAVASRCRSAGWQVAIVDSRPFGGTCALRGCDPKKVLVGAAEVIDWGRRMEGKGVQAQQLRMDWPKLMRFKRSFTEPKAGKPGGNDLPLRPVDIPSDLYRFAGHEPNRHCD